jgi:hypothetical protein
MRPRQNKDELTDVVSRIAAKLVKTPGLFPLVSAIAGDLMTEWSYDSKIKKALTFPVKKLLPGEARDDLQPQTSMAADIGKLLTLLAMAVNESRAKNPGGNGKVRGQGAKDFFVNSDFGEILEMIANSEDSVQPAIAAFNEVLWTYPTKFTTLVAMLGPLYRMGVKLLNEFLAPILSDVGPDLLGDIINAVLKDSDSAGLAKLIDGVNELIRRIHTGSLLIGKGDRSKLDMTLDDLVKAYHGAKNPYLMKMMPVYFGEICESIANASERSLRDNEDLFLAQISSLGAVKTSDIKVKNARMRLFEGVDQEKLGEVMSENLKEFDTYEGAGLINSTCGVLNRIHDAQPGILGSLITGVVDSVSTDEVKKTAEWLIPDIVNAVKPLVSAIMPELLKGLSDLAQDDGYAGVVAGGVK